MILYTICLIVQVSSYFRLAWIHTTEKLLTAKSEKQIIKAVETKVICFNKTIFNFQHSSLHSNFFLLIVNSYSFFIFNSISSTYISNFIQRDSQSLSIVYSQRALLYVYA